MKKFIYFVLLILFPIVLKCQIGGISNSKVNAISVATLPLGKAEFEPSYSYSQFSKVWNAEGTLINAFASADSLVVDASLNLRMAYTLIEHLELGCNLGTDYSNWSFKYVLYQRNKLGFGVMGGINMPFGYAEIDRGNRKVDQLSTYGFGLMSSYEFSEKSSIDFNVQFQDYFYSTKDAPKSDIFLSCLVLK